MKRIIIILTFFLILINSVAYANSNTVKKDILVTSQDGFRISATFEYPKLKDKTEFSTVVLLHSLGYSSEWWSTLPNDLLNKGYAVLNIDLRGHGKSVYNAKLVRTSWKNMTNNAYMKYPEDVIKVIEQIKSENVKKTFFNDWAIVGADIGGITGVYVAEKVSYKPKTIVFLSPIIETKGLYAPVKLAHLDGIDIFSISGTNDITGANAQNYMKRFAQSTFVTYLSKSSSNGMLMLKNDNSLSKVITSWLEEYLKR